MTIRLKRIYDQRASEDGYRVLVDRLWPRGVSKEEAAIDLWLKDVAPSRELRSWFGHQPDRFLEFAERYRAELDDNAAVDQLRELVREHPTVTLLYGARDTRCNQAIVLADHLGSS